MTYDELCVMLKNRSAKEVEPGSALKGIGPRGWKSSSTRQFLVDAQTAEGCRLRTNTSLPINHEQLPTCICISLHAPVLAGPEDIRPSVILYTPDHQVTHDVRLSLIGVSPAPSVLPHTLQIITMIGRWAPPWAQALSIPLWSLGISTANTN